MECSEEFLASIYQMEGTQPPCTPNCKRTKNVSRHRKMSSVRKILLTVINYCRICFADLSFRVCKQIKYQGIELR
jgi:hypothetical protein